MGAPMEAQSVGDPSALLKLVEKLTSESERISDAATDLRMDAASWREAADMTSGHAAGRLTRDALDNERKASEAESLVELLSQAAEALLCPRP